MKTALFIFLFSSCVFSQIVAPDLIPQRCNLDTTTAPNIRGLKISMSKSEIEKILILERLPMQIDEHISEFNSNKFLQTDKFKNVSRVQSEFFKDLILSFTVFYERDFVNWKDSNEFAENLSNNWKIPASLWNISTSNKATLDCKDFSIEISAYSSSIKLTNLNNLNLLVKFKEQEEENKKKKFKP